MISQKIKNGLLAIWNSSNILISKTCCSLDFSHFLYWQIHSWLQKVVTTSFSSVFLIICYPSEISLIVYILYSQAFKKQNKTTLFSLSRPPALRDVHPWPTYGRDPSAGPFPRPWAISRSHVRAESWTVTWLFPRDDGPQPRSPLLRSSSTSTGPLRLPTGRHAPNAQGTFVGIYQIYL